MIEKQRKRLDALSTIGRIVHFKDKGTTEHTKMGAVVDEVSVIVRDYKHFIQRIQADEPYWDGSLIAYRTCYYTFEAKGKNLKFGQYTQFLTEKEYATLLSKARAKGWPLFDALQAVA